MLRSPLERLHWLRQVAASEVPGAATRVAIVIASHINAESGWCHPSSETIGREANVTNVRRATGELKDAGFLISTLRQFKVPTGRVV
jgi:hypothetical protein